MIFEKNASMKDHTTFRIGGPAEYFFVARTANEVLEAIKKGKEDGLNVFLFGGGSNLLVSDKGIKGLVIKIESTDDFSIQGDLLTANAGVLMETLVDASVAAGLKGLEWAGGLPGSFGGAIRGNAGCFGSEMKDWVFEVKALDSDYNLHVFDNTACQFSYRNSVFKERGWIILSASVKLKPGDAAELRKIADSRIAYRQKNHPLEFPSAGSVFKNIPVEIIPAKFMELFREKVKMDPFPIVPAAWFIIAAGLPGEKMGKAQVSEKHSNYIVNTGDATAQEVWGLITRIREGIKKTYGIEMEPEIQYVE